MPNSGQKKKIADDPTVFTAISISFAHFNLFNRLPVLAAQASQVKGAIHFNAD